MPLNGLSLDITRIFGAALVLITLLAWGASNLSDKPARRMVASGLCIYTPLGMIVSLMGQLAGNWGPLGWSNVMVYLVISLGYAYFLFLKPE